MEQVAAVVCEQIHGPIWCRVSDQPACGTPVVLPTRFGVALGQVRGPLRELPDPPPERARAATAADLARAAENARWAADGLRLVTAQVERHQLPMKMVRCFWALDRRQVTFFYTAPGRVDFRALLRDLVRAFPAPIRLEQVGDRDVARMVGALGRCGREVCCRAWMPHFQAISVTHAREQGLAALPVHLAGQCNRLRCCLRFELDDDASAPRTDRDDPRLRPVRVASYHPDEDEIAGWEDS
ncbi:MAG: hypothetical protein IT204_25290 [Fimbriimonadaceae bacterium]|nr:hypothetical protein [Fimbriimonadaceae bacterium]